MKLLRIENNMITVLLILATLAIAQALYIQSEYYTKQYVEVLLTIEGFEAVVRYTANSLYLKLAKRYTLGFWLWLALAATILLQAVN